MEHELGKRFNTIDGESLMNHPLEPVRFVVDSLLGQGLYLLAGSPKVGKSWLALWLASYTPKVRTNSRFPAPSTGGCRLAPQAIFSESKKGEHYAAKKNKIRFGGDRTSSSSRR